MNKLEDSLGYLISQAAHSLNLLLNKKFQEKQLTVTSEQWKILACLWMEDGMSQQSMAKLTCKDKTSVARLLDNMEKRDLIVRIDDKHDKRKKLIYLTHKGKSIKGQLTEQKEETLSKVTGGLKKSDVGKLKTMLTHIIQNCNEQGTLRDK